MSVVAHLMISKSSKHLNQAQTTASFNVSLPISSPDPHVILSGGLEMGLSNVTS